MSGVVRADRPEERRMDPNHMTLIVEFSRDYDEQLMYKVLDDAADYIRESLYDCDDVYIMLRNEYGENL